MPAGQPWQKSATLLARAAHRLAMCWAAIEGVEGLGVEPCETLRPGNTYTVDTLRYLSAKHPETRYTLIIGADQANHLDSWHEWQALLGLCRLAVVARNGLAVTLPPAVQTALVAYKGFDLLQLPAVNVSSSAIRAQIAAHQSVGNQMPAAVERYIVKHSLYKTL